MKVSSILVRKGREVHTIRPEQPISDAVKSMVDQHIGALIVVDADARPISIISERDILSGVQCHCARMTEFTVADLMAGKLISCSSEESIDDAMQLMNHNETGHRIRHLAVIDNGELSGVVTVGDIVDALLTERSFENQLLRNYIKHWPEEENGAG